MNGEYKEIMKLSNKVLVANFYDKEDLEQILGREISDREYEIIIRQWRKNGWFDRVNEIIRQWYNEYREDIEKEAKKIKVRLYVEAEIEADNEEEAEEEAFKMLEEELRNPQQALYDIFRVEVKNE